MSYKNFDVYDAIHSKKRIQVKLDSDPDTASWRVIEPYVYGYNENSNELLRAWQVSGYSASGLDNGRWRLFRVDRIKQIAKDASKFTASNRRKYEPDDDSMCGFYIRIDGKPKKCKK